MLLWWTALALAGTPEDPVLDALASEIDRAMTELGHGEDAPYFLGLEATEVHGVSITGEEGALQGWAPLHRRHVDVDVRLGSPQLDSTHALRGNTRDGRETHGSVLPLTDDVDLLRHAVWDELDDAVHRARERWGRVQSDREVLVSEDTSWDLAPVKAVVDLQPVVELDLDVEAWEETVRRASSVIARSPIVHDGSVNMSANVTTYWVVTSEGTRVRHTVPLYRVFVSLDTVADDGDRLTLHQSWDSHTAAELPDAAELETAVAVLQDRLAAIRVAPEQEPYTGPAILSDRAAGVFFHEVFGHRVEGHRLKHVDNAQTFRSRVGEPILPEFLSVVDDPTLERWGELPLRGHYAYDNEGVPAQRAVLVQDGVLQGFLQSRSPVEATDRSNGHGRRSAGYQAVTRQGNLIVESSRSMSDEALREELVRTARDAGLEYGLYVEDIQGGFTFTSRGMPNAFQVDVLEAWRVYVDGRPDELVRGANIIGTPLVAFSAITHAGELHRVFNGTCGAESGWVPVSAVSPALLLEQVETQRKAKGQTPPPLLPPPTATGGDS